MQPILAVNNHSSLQLFRTAHKKILTVNNSHGSWLPLEMTLTVPDSHWLIPTVNNSHCSWLPVTLILPVTNCHENCIWFQYCIKFSNSQWPMHTKINFHCPISTVINSQTPITIVNTQWPAVSVVTSIQLTSVVTAINSHRHQLSLQLILTDISHQYN